MQEVDLRIKAGGQRSEEVRGGTRMRGKDEEEGGGGRRRRKEEEEGGKQTVVVIYFTKSDWM